LAKGNMSHNATQGFALFSEIPRTGIRLALQSTCPTTGGQVLIEPVQKPVHHPLGFLIGVAVSLLDQAYQLIPTACYLIELVVGKSAPLNLGFATDLLPFAFEDVRIHFLPPIYSRRSEIDWLCLEKQTAYLRRSHFA